MNALINSLSCNLYIVKRQIVKLIYSTCIINYDSNYDKKIMMY